MNEQILGHVVARPGGRAAGGALVRNRLARWLAERRAFRALIADHERGGYAISPATWRRMRDEARDGRPAGSPNPGT